MLSSSAEESELVPVCQALQFVKVKHLTIDTFYRDCKFLTLALMDRLIFSVINIL